jgi:hypothetical protein
MEYLWVTQPSGLMASLSPLWCRWCVMALGDTVNATRFHWLLCELCVNPLFAFGFELGVTGALAAL